MNCCQKDNQGPEDNQISEENHGKHKGHMSHMLMMLLCCGGPLVLLMLLPLIGSVIPGSAVVMAKIIPFICPIMMVLMIPMMFKSQKDKGSE